MRGGGTSYYLLGGVSSGFKDTGGRTLCLWHAICSEREHSSVFDFEGSMVRSIDRSFSRFGGEHVPYHSIKSIALASVKNLRVVLSS